METELHRRDSVDLSIIIVTYNSAEEIGNCLDTLDVAQKKISVELILIDNGSDDNTRQIIANYNPRFAQFDVVTNDTNFGFTKAVNQGLRKATGRFILLLNPDTFIPENTFSVLIDKFANNREIGIVSPLFRFEDGAIQPSCRRFPKHRDILFHFLGLHVFFSKSGFFNGWKMGDFDHLTERFVDQPQGAFLLIKRDAFEVVGLLNEKFPMFFSDVDWCHRFINNGWKILFTPNCFIIHSKGKSIYRDRIPLIWSSHRSFIRYFNTYYNRGLWPVINFITAVVLICLASLRTIFTFITRR